MSDKEPRRINGYMIGDTLEFVPWKGNAVLLNSLSPEEQREYQEWESKQEKTSFVVSAITSEPKPACDHIVGEFEQYYSEYDLIRESEYKKMITSLKDDDYKLYFNFCPLCGEKLNTTK